MTPRPGYLLLSGAIRGLGSRLARPRILPPSSRRSPAFSTGAQASSSSASHTSHPPPKPHQRGFYIPLSLLVLVPTIYYLWPSSPPTLAPHTYSDHPISSSIFLTPAHKLITVPLPSASLAAFQSGPSGSRQGNKSGAEGGQEVVVQHVMIKNPDLQIERPYTPINDVAADGELRLVVKRVKGGEVGRHVHAISSGSDIGLRGPIETLRIRPGDYDRIIMISSGTGIAPFLQLLSKVPATSGTERTQYHLLHASTKDPQADWVRSPDLAILERLRKKHGAGLRIDRVSLDPLDRTALSNAMKRDREERLMVLVCLPPHLMRPICGPLTITLSQGELTGVLKELGLQSEEVWKLE